MKGHKICVCDKIWKIIPKLSLLPLLIYSTAIAKNKHNSGLCGSYGSYFKFSFFSNFYSTLFIRL